MQGKGQSTVDPKSEKVNFHFIINHICSISLFLHAGKRAVLLLGFTASKAGSSTFDSGLTSLEDREEGGGRREEEERKFKKTSSFLNLV